MKRFITAALITALCLTLCGCTETESETENGNINIVATVFPAYDFAREITEGSANITLLVPPGSEVHGFEPTPQDIIRIEKCDLLICNGGEGEVWLEEILEGLEKEIRVVTMLDCVDALEEETKEGMQGA
ncbi:MAG: metal ABC transporter substrate-binding protein, partial [Eubacteriales bacterium]|nr:metal ABC transporter substrate-binding protein [Eubacteriales bacterium]